MEPDTHWNPELKTRQHFVLDKGEMLVHAVVAAVVVDQDGKRHLKSWTLGGLHEPEPWEIEGMLTPALRRAQENTDAAFTHGPEED